MKRYTLQSFVADIDGKPRPTVPSAVGDDSNQDTSTLVKQVSVQAQITIQELRSPKHSKGQELNKVVVLYAFEKADDSPEMSVGVGEELILLENSGDGWSRCRRANGEEGYVPTYILLNRSYIKFIFD